MSYDDDLLQRLDRLERRVRFIGYAVIICMAGFAAWFAYRELPTSWGIGEGVAGFIAFVLYIGAVKYLTMIFDSD